MPKLGLRFCRVIAGALAKLAAVAVALEHSSAPFVLTNHVPQHPDDLLPDLGLARAPTQAD